MALLWGMLMICWLITAAVAAPLQAVSAFFATITFGVLVYAQFIRPKLRKRALKNPVEMYYSIVNRERFIIDYLVQDEHYHRITELIVPSHEKVLIYFAFTTKTHFSHSETILSIKHKDGLKHGPRPISFRNPFVLKGKIKEASPETDDSDYIDVNFQYHRLISRDRVLGSDFTSGYIVDTGAPGCYIVDMAFVGGDEVEGLASVSFIVAHEPKEPMRCRVHKNCWIKPAPRKSGWREASGVPASSRPS